MMKRIFVTLALAMAFAMLFVTCDGISDKLIPKREEINALRNAEIESHWEEGRRAYRAGVSAEANPYKGSQYSTTRGKWWLEGYIGEAEHAKRNKLK